MISSVATSKGTDAITSDRWHVVHSHFVGADASVPFVRSITSEHEDRASCVDAARALASQIRREAGEVPLPQRDQVFVRRPGFKSMCGARRRFERAPRRSKGGDS